MKEKTVPKSPVFPADKQWQADPSEQYYESEVTALVRNMLEDPQIRADQQYAWQRWRSGNDFFKKD
jgi:hypothetical protein